MIPWSRTLAGVAGSVLGLRRGKRDNARSDRAAAVAQEEEPKRLALAAFGTVAAQFRWDAADGRWVKAGG